MTRSRPITFLLAAAAVGAIPLAVAGCGGREKVMRKLRKSGNVKVTPRITFTPRGGDPRTQSRGLELKRP
jgi:hypothetical protein